MATKLYNHGTNYSRMYTHWARVKLKMSQIYKRILLNIATMETRISEDKISKFIGHHIKRLSFKHELKTYYSDV